MNHLYLAFALCSMVGSAWVTGCDKTKPLALSDLTQQNKNGLILLLLKRDAILQASLQSLAALSESEREFTQAERQFEKIKTILSNTAARIPIKRTRA